jgi:hypothetical protein
MSKEGAALAIPPRLALPLLVSLGVMSGEPPLRAGQAAVQVERASAESGSTITCEVFCSDTKLRTSNARIRWYDTKADAQASSAASARPTLQATVFAQGFEKNLYVTVPVGADASPQAPGEAAAVTQRQRPLRAFQFRVLQLEQARASALGTPESGIVVEDLEPGMTYRWRLATSGAVAGQSPVVACKALVCPADMVREPGQPPAGNRP